MITVNFPPMAYWVTDTTAILCLLQRRCSQSCFNLATMLASCEDFVLLWVDAEVGLFLHVAICETRAGWQDVTPDMNLHCVIEVSSFCLCWQMDSLCNVFGSKAHR